MTKKKVAVFGSSGFVGKKLALTLAESGCHVFGVDKQEPQIKKSYIPWHTTILDLREVEDFSAIPLDLDCAVFLAAALPLTSEGAVEGANIAIGNAYSEFLEARLPRSAILISSSSVYDARAMRPFGKDDDPQPTNGYGRSKLSVEQQLGESANKLGIPLTIIRPTPIVGEGRNGLFEVLKELIQKRFPIPIPNPQSDLQVTDLTDLIEFIRDEIEDTTGRVWGAGNPGALSFEGYAKVIATSVGVKPMLIRLPTPVFRALGNFAIRARLTKLTRWHLDAITHIHKFDDAMLPQRLISAKSCPLSLVSSVE